MTSPNNPSKIYWLQRTAVLFLLIMQSGLDSAGALQWPAFSSGLSAGTWPLCGLSSRVVCLLT